MRQKYKIEIYIRRAFDLGPTKVTNKWSTQLYIPNLTGAGDEGKKWPRAKQESVIGTDWINTDFIITKVVLVCVIDTFLCFFLSCDGWIKIQLKPPIP